MQKKMAIRLDKILLLFAENPTAIYGVKIIADKINEKESLVNEDLKYIIKFYPSFLKLSYPIGYDINKKADLLNFINTKGFLTPILDKEKKQKTSNFNKWTSIIAIIVSALSFSYAIWADKNKSNIDEEQSSRIDSIKHTLKNLTK